MKEVDNDAKMPSLLQHIFEKNAHSQLNFSFLSAFFCIVANPIPTLRRGVLVDDPLPSCNQSQSLIQLNFYFLYSRHCFSLVQRLVGISNAYPTLHGEAHSVFVLLQINS